MTIHSSIDINEKIDDKDSQLKPNRTKFEWHFFYVDQLNLYIEDNGYS